MIYELRGILRRLEVGFAVIEVGPVSYEVLMPAAALGELQPLIGQELALHTLEYLEGNPTVGNLIPRLVGFVRAGDRAFFQEFIKVKGISMRKGLKALALPAHQIAAAIEGGDERLLTSLPEIGKRTAAQIITDLRGKLGEFVRPESAPAAVAPLNDMQMVAIEIMTRWGDRRVDAQRWVQRATELDPALATADALVTAAYRVKGGA